MMSCFVEKQRRRNAVKLIFKYVSASGKVGQAVGAAAMFLFVLLILRAKTFCQRPPGSASPAATINLE